MTKRIAAALLWFLVGWYTWGFIALAGDLPMALGPVLGLVLAAFVAGDPLHRVWSPRVSNERIESRLRAIHTNV